jgi:hypothetical protein
LAPLLEARKCNFHYYDGVTFAKKSFLEDLTVPDRSESWQRYVIRFKSIPGITQSQVPKWRHFQIADLFVYPFVIFRIGLGGKQAAYLRLTCLSLEL